MIQEHVKKCENCGKILKVEYDDKIFTNKKAGEAVIFNKIHTVKFFEEQYHFFCNNICYDNHKNIRGVNNGT